ncbi:hypothetical protein SPRG_19727 [Saprolegnia parasitica CBS 223.65]|uniref:Uncharacterized protein n=1 Tax=Saprolegnia parasitica (strain CBS 223.65) TaxID=695850 RepID=A0A067CKW5_SAPPC|nr:hypothetical protein SPRG_19727 [Saprolegnia parasitica CBS 223.65]KDO29845.1 hypothetical protein SPRG_19727 [Saprolegnia parasitica CBS 223.65]|eukprot:XP_012199546.1 hypothetical protein SPRG_19727 [Saprolegnia parasitica CBS 223.65]
MKDAPAPAPKKGKGKAAVKPAPKPAANDSEDDEVEMDFEELVAAGAALQKLGAVDAAAETFAKALAMQPEDVDVMSSLAHAYEACDEKTKAIALHEKVVTRVPTNAPTWFALGALYQDVEKLEKAISAFRKVIALDDANASVAFAALANCYGEQGDIDGAVGVFESAVAKDPSNAKYQYNLATMLVARGTKADQKKAITAYEAALALETNRQRDIYDDLAALYDSMGDKAKAAHAREMMAKRGR